MRRELIPTRPGYAKVFRETFRLRDDVAGDPTWQLAYEYAARYCLYPDELNAIGPVLVRRVEGDPEYSTPEFIRWLPQP